MTLSILIHNLFEINNPRVINGLVTGSPSSLIIFFIFNKIDVTRTLVTFGDIPRLSPPVTKVLVTRKLLKITTRKIVLKDLHAVTTAPPPLVYACVTPHVFSCSHQMFSHTHGLDPTLPTLMGGSAPIVRLFIALSNCS